MFLYILEEIYDNGKLIFTNFYSINLKHNLRLFMFNFDFKYYEKRKEAALEVWKERKGEKISEEEHPIDKMLNEEATMSLIRTISSEIQRSIGSEIFTKYIIKSYKPSTALDIISIGLDGIMWVVTPMEKLWEAIKKAVEEKKDILIYTKYDLKKGIISSEIRFL